MISSIDILPIADNVAPTDQEQVCDTLREAHDQRRAVYPIGGQTALDLGLKPSREGLALETSGLAEIVEYTPRDMTVVAGSGVKMADLAATLLDENQHLPIDAPRATEATVGGMLATNWSGPRRHGYGTLRDYVIGIKAVDGRGVPFKGGGKVVKNVAGYDFCKLLLGSLGTLGVITEVTFKVKPKPADVVTVMAECGDLDIAEKLLVGLSQTPAALTSVDLLLGTGWENLTGSSLSDQQSTLVASFDGTSAETDWMQSQLESILTGAGGKSVRVLTGDEAQTLYANQVDFAGTGRGEGEEAAPLVMKITCVPSGVTKMIEMLLEVDPSSEIQAHAASGAILARLLNFDAADLTSVLVGQLRPAAIQHQGNLTVLSSTFEGLTEQVVWGGRNEASDFTERIKRQFDPHDILNPGRYLY